MILCNDNILYTVEYCRILCNTVEYYVLCLFKILYTVSLQDTIYCVPSRYCVSSRYYTIIIGQEMSDKKK